MASGSTVRSIRARAVDVPLRKRVETAAGTLTTAPVVLVDLLTEDGIAGCGYAAVYSRLVMGPLARLVENLGELIVGGPADPTAARKVLRGHFRLLGLQGLAGIAVATIDMALWDVQARATGQPLATLLGGTLEPVPAYASLASMDPDVAAVEAHEALEGGFAAFKVKLGASDLAADLDTVRAVRRVIGPDAELMVDYNQVLTVAEAIDRGRRLDAEGLVWVEEPTRGDDMSGNAEIAAQLRTAIQLGENWWSVDDLDRAIAAGACRHVMFDVMRIGGVSGWMRAADRAHAAGLPVSSHMFPEFSAHLLAATPTAYRLEYADKFSTILRRPVDVADGCVRLSDAAGAGVAWDEAAIDRAARA
jgi:mandelate racemase